MSRQSFQLKAPSSPRPNVGNPSTFGCIEIYQGLLGIADSEQMAVTNGWYYGVGVYEPALINGGSIDILIQTGSTGQLELVSIGAIVSVSANTTIEVYENTTFSNAGTALPALQVNRTSSEASASITTKYPVITDLGTRIFQAFLPGDVKGGGVFPIGGSDSSFQRLLGAPDTSYLVRVTNVNGGPQHTSLSVSLIEVPSL